MRACPECGEAGIYEHSVLVALEQAKRATSVAELDPFVRCADCSVAFRRLDARRLERVSDGEAPGDGETLWTRPPWVPASDEADFEMSWDLTQHFFATLTGEAARLAPIRRLIRILREQGYGPRLRAGQSLSTLLLSRARSHGLRQGQCCLELVGRPDGLVSVSGIIAGARIDEGGVAGELTGRLAEQLQALVERPIE